MTLIVLAIDGLDFGLVEEWDLENIKLDNYRKTETFDNGSEQPYTLEVWTSIATGVHPDEHGITRDSSSDWNRFLNPVFHTVGKYLPLDYKVKIHGVLKSMGILDYEIAKTDLETFMDGDRIAVHNWPCVENNNELRSRWKLFEDRENYNTEEFEVEIFGECASRMGWANQMLNHNLKLAAVHIHALDLYGHLYSGHVDEDNMDKSVVQEKRVEGSKGVDDISQLKKSYEFVDELIKDMRENLSDDDEILILSDHGMNNRLLDDKDIAMHSYRSFASTTLDVDLPESVFDYKKFIENNYSEVEDTDVSDVDMPEDRLRQLGYIE